MGRCRHMACIPFRTMVSIITPCYNSSTYICETIRSIQKQTYTNWELIIVDDHSTDNSVEKIKELAKGDSRIRLIELKERVGMAEACNIAIESAKGHYLSFIQSHDLWAPHKLERQLEFMEIKNIAFCYTNYQFIDENSHFYEPPVKMPEKITYQDLLKNITAIGCLTVMIDLYKVGKIKMMNDQNIPADNALWLSILKRGFKGYGVNEVLAYRRKTTSTLVRNNYKEATKFWYLYRNVEKLNIFIAAYCLMNHVKNEAKFSKHTIKKDAQTSTQA